MDMDEVADLLFSLLISYVGALEFMYVIRHLYHWSFRHDVVAGGNETSSGENLQSLQDRLRSQLSVATESEQRSGYSTMQDGVVYRDGFRIDPNSESINQMKNDPEYREQRRKEIEAELQRQMEIEEETRKQLELAELALAEERERMEKEALENEKRLMDLEKIKEEEQKLQEEEQAENERIILELENARQEEQRLQELALLEAEEQAENERIILELENARQEEQKLQELALLEAEEEAENERKLLELKSACQEIARIQAAEEAENQRKFQELENALEEEQKLQDIAQQQAEEEAENEKKLLELENAKEMELKLLELEQEHLENEMRIFEAEKSLAEEQKNLELQEGTEEDPYLRQMKEEEDALEFARQLIAREKMFEDSEKSDREISPDSFSEEISEKDFIKIKSKKEEMSPESKKKMIEENARRFLEAEEEMVQLLESEKVPVEEPIIQKVKTQFGQTGAESYAVSSKSLLFPSLSDEGSSVDPKSSQQSSFSTEPSEEVTTTGPEDAAKQFPQTERQDPEGEDNIPDIQFSDEYLRSLDGIKHRPLIREDGSGRRRAFKKRRSSGSSNSSRDSRASRDEELKMFTSLEEEEMHRPDTDFAPIKYTSEPNLKVKAHHRRHKRSPAKDCKVLDESLKGSMEMLGEEAINPWGDVVPEQYKHSEFWKREKAMSIDEEEIEIDLASVSPDLRHNDGLEESELESSRLKHKTSSFEDATKEQSEEAAVTLQQQQKGNEASEPTMEESNTTTAQNTPSDSENRKNLQASQDTEEISRSARSSPGLRRSPRIGDHMDEYEDQFDVTKSPSNSNSPAISIHQPTDEDRWRDEHGLLIQGLSDFYDFTASANPSRSRSTSRAPSPHISSNLDSFRFSKNEDQSLEDPGESFEDPIETIRSQLILKVSKESNEIQVEAINSPSISVEEPEDERIIDEHGSLLQGISDFYDFTSTINQSRSRPTSRASSPMPKNVNFSQRETTFETEILNSELLETYLETSCKEGATYSLSSIDLDVYDDTENMENESPNFEDITHLIDSTSLEEASALARNLRTVADKPAKSEGLTEIVPLVFINDNNPDENETDSVMDQIINRRSYSRSESEKSSRSRSTSPLPTTSNLARSIQSRKEKRIQYNEQIFEKLQISSEESSQQESHSEKYSESSSKEFSQSSKEEMNSLIESLRIDRVRSHSRSKSPLPSALNLEKSLEARRHKRIQQNDELLEKLERQLSPSEMLTQEDTSFLAESLRIEEGRSRSRSRSPFSSARIREEKIETRQIEIIEQREEHIEQIRREEMTSLIDSLRAERVRSSRSRTPLPPSRTTEENIESFEQTFSHESGSFFAESSRTERGRSKSPLPSGENFKMRIESQKSERIQQNEEVFEQFCDSSQSSQTKQKIFTENPVIFIENADTMKSERYQKSVSPEEDMSSLIATLRSHRSRSRSKSPMRLPSAANLDSSLDSRRKKLIERNDHLKEQLDERAKTPEPPRLTVEYVFEVEEQKSEPTVDQPRDRQSRSRTPSRSPPPVSEILENDSQSSTPLDDHSKGSSSSNLSSLDNLNDYLDFHMMLNLEASANRTLVKSSEELETCLLSKQIEIDSEALEKFKTAIDEIELRTVSPTHIQTQAERLRKLKCTPTTPDYNRTISEEWLDSQRIKENILQRGFKRSTYVGESMDLGAEYEPLRREAAVFKRSRTPSPSIHIVDDDLETSRRNAAEARQVQAQILGELSKASGSGKESENKHGAIPKSDISRISIQSADSVQINLEDLRRQTAEFRRSRSKSRSPLQSPNLTDNVRQDIIDEVYNNSQRFKEFSRNLNVDFLESERRASDSALIQKPDQEIEDLEPEEYHHYRRFSLAQEQPVEAYPDDDFVYVSQIEVRTPKGTRTWLQEDYYSEHLQTLNVQLSEVLGVLEETARENENDWLRNDDESNGSEDERQTVVEVEDEIEEDLVDYNERGTTDESHHEISECEEADREQDRFAGRGAQDWQNVNNDFFDYGFQNDSVSERAATASQPQTLAYDSDSFAIDQIYEEAIKNRKQSGIMRDYDCILEEMSNGLLDKSSQLSSADSDSDRERYALWAKTRALKKANHIELARSFLEKEKKDNEIRYLGDAEATARQSARLRSRYGYLPVLPGGSIDDLEVDLNYRPKKEYNWRKNFKLDEEDLSQNQKQEEEKEDENSSNPLTEMKEEIQDKSDELVDIRKFSLGGESITLFSQSPEREKSEKVLEDASNLKGPKEGFIEVALASMGLVGGPKEKVKKKKTKKKTRKEMKAQEELYAKDDEDSESQLFSRRSSSTQMDTDSPKRTSRSRRSSKASTEDSSLLFSPRSSVGLPEPIWDITEEYVEPSAVVKKKTKKRKKSKNDIAEHKTPTELLLQEIPTMEISEALTISCSLSNDNTEGYLLASISPQMNKCLTPPSEESDTAFSKEPDSKDGSNNSFDVSVSDSFTTKDSTSRDESLKSLASSASDIATSIDKLNDTTVATHLNVAASLNSLTAVPQKSSSTLDSFDFLKDGNFYPLF